MTFLVATFAGAIGATSRYVVTGWLQERTRSGYPVGTLAVNLAGAFLLGLAAGFDQTSTLAMSAAFGFLAGFTTFSTWMIETIRLGIPPMRSKAVANLLLTLFVGVTLAAAGYSLTH